MFNGARITVVLSMLACLTLGLAGPVNAEPSFDMDCTSCHDPDTGRMELTGHDTTVNLGSGLTKVYQVIGGEIAPISTRVLDGSNSYAVRIAGLSSSGEQNSGNTLNSIADPGWVSFGNYFTSVSGGTSWGGSPTTWVFDLGVDVATPLDYYPLEVIVAGKGGGQWYQAETVYVQVLAAAPQNYTLTVNSGSGSGSYTAGHVAAISANAPPAGQQFNAWVGNTGGVANVNAASTNLTMPAANQAVTATYSSTLAGDLDDDGVCGIYDLNMVLIDWGKSVPSLTDPRSDADGDGTVTIYDLNYVLIDWGKTVTP